MFERQLQSLYEEINHNEIKFELLTQSDHRLNRFLSAGDLIERFLASKDVPWQSEIINVLIQLSNKPQLQQFCFLILTAIFWRNLTYLVMSCSERQITSEDLLAQSSLILLQLICKSAKKPDQQKMYGNLSRSLRRDFYIWVKENNFEFSEIPKSQPELPDTHVDTDKIIRRILSDKILKKTEVDLWLEVERDERSLKEIAREKGINYDAFQKRIRRINKKIEKHGK